MITLLDPTVQMLLVLGLTGVAVVLYVTEWISLEMTSLMVIAVLMVLFHIAPVTDAAGEVILGPADMVKGFANPALITVLALLVVGDGIVRAGFLDRVAGTLARTTLGSVGTLFLMLLAAGFLSAFLNNTPVVVIFIPLFQALATRYGLPGGRVMMPLSFVAILGGMTTLAGSSTNLLVSNTLAKQGMERISFFEMTPMALLMAGVGLVYVVLVLPRLLPDRTSMTSRVIGSRKQFIAQVAVTESSDLVDERAVAGRFEKLSDLTIRMILRNEQPILPPFEDEALRPGDVLIVAGTRQALTDVAQRLPGVLQPPDGEGAEPVHEPGTIRRVAGSRGTQLIVEAMVTPSSRLIGQALRQLALRQRYGTTVLGIERRARMIRTQMMDIRLEAGDSLILQGDPEALDRLQGERDLVILSGTTVELPRGDRAWPAGVLFAGAIGLAAVGAVPILVAAIVAAVGMIGIGALNIRQASRALDQKILLVVAAALAIGEAMQATGGATAVANTLLDMTGRQDPDTVVIWFFLLVALFTNILSNNACAVLFTPIALDMAVQTGGDPRAFALAVLLAANCSFASPIGYKTNLLVMGPGHYHFMDFVRGGLPLLLLMWGVYAALRLTGFSLV